MLCLKCNKETSNPKFCSNSCAASLNNKIRIYKNKTYKNCKYCNKILERTQNKFCSSTCCGKLKKEKTKQRILQTGAINSNNTGREFLKNTRGIKCEICSITEWQGRTVPLVMDHINGNPEDNSLENLRLVCGNCDMQLPTYKSKNRGNGRAIRRKRYEEGKSY